MAVQFRVLISIHGYEDSRANRDSMANADRFLDRGIDIDFYDAATVPIW
ncbi:hypothetical protein [Vibrio natriegens]|nr:hypothetical protein [Vibrio natriegens]